MIRKLVAPLITIAFLGFSVWLAQPWIIYLNIELGIIFAWIILVGMVWIPSVGTSYIAASLLTRDKKIYKQEIDPPVTVLIACYNEEDTIIDTLVSILKSDYKNISEIIVSDDGSTDKTIYVIEKYIKRNLLLERPIRIVYNKTNKGKAAALNSALPIIKDDIIVTVDADTTLRSDAISYLIDKFISDNYSAVAGALRVSNFKDNWITKIQYWDYITGIAASKQAQSVYDKTLVAQGAFSAFNLNDVISVGGWKEVVGEDIVLSWDLINKGNKIGHAKYAIGYTNVPTTYKQFFNQRKRWARGLVEAFKQNWSILTNRSSELPFVWYNLLFPYIDISFIGFFIPGVILATLFGNYLLVGLFTLLLIPLGFLMMLPIIKRQNDINKELGLTFEGSYFSFFMYLLFYQFLQPLATLSGYASEFLGLRKTWGTKKAYVETHDKYFEQLIEEEKEEVLIDQGKNN